MASERRPTLSEMLPDDPAILHGDGPSIESSLRQRSSSLVLDYGAGDTLLRKIVESYGHSYIGIDPFSSSTQVRGSGEALPFRDASFGIVISNAVFEHLLDPAVGIREISRVLMDGGVIVGYAAYLENFHEISYHHLSHKALEHLFTSNGVRLVELKADAFSFDYQLGTLLVPGGRPEPVVRLLRRSIRKVVILVMKAQAGAAAFKHHRLSAAAAADYRLRLDLLKLKYAAGYDFVAQKGTATDGRVAHAPSERAPGLAG